MSLNLVSTPQLELITLQKGATECSLFVLPVHMQTSVIACVFSFLLAPNSLRLPSRLDAALCLVVKHAA